MNPTTDLPSNSTLDVKLDYITRDIREIKADVKEMKSDYVSRREFDAGLKDLEIKFLSADKIIEEKINPLAKVVYAGIGLICVGVVGSLLSLILIK